MQSGFLLVTAIFLLVILAALGAFILTISGTQQTSSALDVQGSRAYQAARAGIEWASYQLLISGGAGGAIAFVQQGSATNSSGTSSITVTLPANVTSGNLLVVTISTDTQMQNISSVSGGGITTWTQAAAVAGLGGTCAPCIRGAMWYGLNSSGGSNTVTVNFTGNDDVAVHVSEWSGVATSAALDGTPVTSGPNTTTSVSTGTLTTTNANDLVIAMGAWDQATVTAGPTNGFTAIQGNPVSSSPSGLVDAYQIVSATGSYSTGWTISVTTQAWVGIIAAFKAQGVAFCTTACNSGQTACDPSLLPQTVTGMGGTLSGFTAAVQCCSSPTTEGGATVTVYQICSTGAQGTVGTLNRVERQLQATLSK